MQKVAPFKFRSALVLVLLFGLFLINTTAAANGSSSNPIANGDFANGLTGWTTGVSSVHRSVNLIASDPPHSNVIEVKSSGAGGLGGVSDAYQDLDVEVTSLDSVMLEADVKAVSATVVNGCGGQGREHPIVLTIVYQDAASVSKVINWGFYFGGGSCGNPLVHPDEQFLTQSVPQNTWVHFASSNLKTLAPDMVKITRIFVAGTGWDYVGRADNIKLLVSSDSVEEPITVDNEARAKLYEHFAMVFKPGILGLLDLINSSLINRLLTSWVPGAAGLMLEATEQYSELGDLEKHQKSQEIKIELDQVYAGAHGVIFWKDGQVLSGESIWGTLEHMAGMIQRNASYDEQWDYFQENIEIWSPSFCKIFGPEVRRGRPADIQKYYTATCTAFDQFIAKEKIALEKLAREDVPPIRTQHLHAGDTESFDLFVSLGQFLATFSSSWSGSDVVMTLTSPSGRVIGRESTADLDVTYFNGPTFEVYSVTNPEPGTWQISLFGADLPPEGEEVAFTFSSVEALAESIINDSLSLVGLSTSYNPTPVEGYAGGVYTVTATWQNITNPTSFFDVFAEVAVLQGSGCPCAVLNADDGPGGVGAKVSLAESLAPGETVTKSFNIGLSSRAPFSFFVNVWGIGTGD